MLQGEYASFAYPSPQNMDAVWPHVYFGVAKPSNPFSLFPSKAQWTDRPHLCDLELHRDLARSDLVTTGDIGQGVGPEP